MQALAEFFDVTSLYYAALIIGAFIFGMMYGFNLARSRRRYTVLPGDPASTLVIPSDLRWLNPE